MFDNYKYYVNKEHGIVVAVTTYAGKPVRGIAKCDPRDTFDEETGKRLAAARCAVKVAQKRNNRAIEKYNEWIEKTKEMSAKYDSLRSYVDDSFTEFRVALENLSSISAKL